MDVTTSRHYPDWKAPSEDGKPLIWPDPADLLAETLNNQKRLNSAYSVRLQRVPLPQLRRKMREFVGHDLAQPLIATGHQTELYHPGVWAKHALTNALATRLGGQAFHIAVDTDAPKHLLVRWPGESVAITDDAAGAAAWAGMLAPPSPSHLDDIAARLREAASQSGWGFEPLLPTFLASMKRLSMESLNLSAALTNAMHELDWGLGLRHHALLASPIWTCEPFLVFVHDALTRADAMAAHYNTALEAYRKEHGVDSHMRPMPDLFAGDEAIEIPFWLDDLYAGTRTRPSVFRTDRGFVLELLDGAQFTFERDRDGWEAAADLRRWLATGRYRISPRALTLTVFLRLLMVDQFIHGIGGGRYDQVADRLIAGHFGLEPPAFSVTTATLYFPTALHQERVCVPCVRQEGHRLRHGLLGQRKQEMVAEIASLPRHSTERGKRFFQMHSELAAAARSSPLLSRWQERLQEAQQREQWEQALFDRELFYAIQPESRLRELIAAYNSALDRI